jgi:hypothetical protein
MATENQSFYFSGQGVVLLGERDAITGANTGLTPVGNVSALSLTVETTVFQHKESWTGQRGIDLELNQEVNVGVNMTMESIDKDNLALALYGTATAVASGSVTGEVVTAQPGKWVLLANIDVSTVVVNGPGGTPTYVLDTDYKLNAEAGSIEILTAGSISQDELLEIDYAYGDQDNVEAVTSSAAPLRWARFEGLNTADGDKAVVVDIYKLSVQPLAELGLINEELAQMELESRALSDPLRSSGSKYFTVRKIA